MRDKDQRRAFRKPDEEAVGSREVLCSFLPGNKGDKRPTRGPNHGGPNHGGPKDKASTRTLSQLLQR